MVSKTKVELRRENLRKLGEWEERIKEMGHDDFKRGLHAVEEVQKEDEKKQLKVEGDILEQLEEKQGDNSYKDALIRWGKNVLKGIGPTKIFLVPTKKGIVVWIRIVGKGWYARGLSLSFDPKSDMIAIEKKIWDAVDFGDVQKDLKINNGYRKQQ